MCSCCSHCRGFCGGCYSTLNTASSAIRTTGGAVVGIASGIGGGFCGDSCGRYYRHYCRGCCGGSYRGCCGGDIGLVSS